MMQIPPYEKRSGSGQRPTRRFIQFCAATLMVCFFSLPAVAAAGQPKSPDTAQKKALAEKAPDFVISDLKGQRFRLSDHRGKRPVLLIFSTTWCTFCRSELPHFKSLFATYAKQGVEVINIDIQESKEKVAKFAAQHELPYRVLLDEDGTVSGVYDIKGVPSMVLIDRNGMIACRQCSSVETILDATLKK
jgi:peroxiredoxin